MSGDALLLGLDVGTASSKGVLTTLTGEVVRTHVVPHGVSNPHPGQYEQDADAVWWADVVTLCRELLQGVAERVAGVAVSAIGPCLLPLDGDGRPCGPASCTAWIRAPPGRSRPWNARFRPGTCSRSAA